MDQLSINEVFKLAVDIVSNTSQSVFLTGKAGTGKTTFLHYIRHNVSKNVIVVAPTGVAAINAGGVTLHSLLQLPFEPFIPDLEGKKKLDYHFKLRKPKIKMLRELDLLIIDEVSMLRADMLDAADYMLRRYRNNQQAFGGVQILFIGDMFQLPPVVQTAEWELLKHYYPSPFFFHAQVLAEHTPLYIELKTIYRQQDQQFIGILNRIRNNCATSQDLEILNRRYDPAFKLPEENRYIVLCTHNYKADRINNEELLRLAGKEYRFDGEITGDFSENFLPTDASLILKVGAQVMFVKNDAGEHRRYYNGKLATVSLLKKDKIRVRFENGEEMDLESETWRNIRFKLNGESREIEEEELGSFTQYPIRLAWAITIHKSQGLTFDRMVIDAGQAFAAGQVYVALSRCTTLEGIVLFSRITAQSISTDPFAVEFAGKEQSMEYLSRILNTEKPRYCAEQLKKYFDWTPFIQSLNTLHELVMEKKIPKQEETQAMIAQVCARAIEQQEIARSFTKEIDRILSAPDPDINYLGERVQKGALYFHKDVREHIIQPVKQHLDSLENESRVKQYQKKVKEIHTALLRLLEKLESVRYGDTNLTEGLSFDKISLPEEDVSKARTEKHERPQRGDSQRLTLSLFNEGKSVEEIARERNFVVATIESHLAGFVLTGELAIERLIDESKIKYMLPVLREATPQTPMSEIKEKLPEECSYSDIKAVMNYIRYTEKSGK
ncbi:MAG: helix-turn-helix domain-containing protein [Prevotella sp.]|jgi:hypothetical protein|nr:helix-turn-helix domain-containing protein [Prevotella sp.]